ncbi:MAG: ABC transporter permease [Chloroflexi bacterium]|nr:ABC transporter permease [Chloroflexota bacterium]MDL1883542.1 ABC transporter permease [Anaerolineae bacterium CFX8]
MVKRLRQTLKSLSIPVLAVILGLIVSSFFVLMAGTDPVQTYQRMFCEGFGSKGCQTFGDLLIVQVGTDDGGVSSVFAPFYGAGGHRMAVVLERATLLILTALSATVAFKAGLFSIGMDGQFVLGAITVAFLGYWLPSQVYMLAGVSDPGAAPQALLSVMHVLIPLVCIGLAMAVGAVYSWIAGYLKVKLNVNELISTIILNAIAVQIVNYLVRYPLRSDFNSTARTQRIDDTAWLIPFNRGLFQDVEWFSGARLGIGIIIAILAAVLIWFFLWRSTAGYEQRMAGGSRRFARFGGIPSERAALRAMLLSGALSGLAGALAILGIERRVIDGYATSGFGFDGVLVAILARESIPGIILVAMFFAGLQQGATNLQFGDLPRQLGGIIIAFIILFSSMENFFRDLITRIQTRLRPRRTPYPTEAGAP